MALIIADRVKETSTTNGDSNFTLSGAVTGFQSFNDAIGIGNACYYVIENPSVGEWEVGIGTVSDATTLVRTTILKSSNSNNAVTFTSGTKNVFVSFPADEISGLATLNDVESLNDKIGAAGIAWLWGHNNWGQLGDNNEIATPRSSPVQTVTRGTNWKQASCGYNSTVAIKTDGTLWTWGYNSEGHLGDGTTAYKISPVQTVVGGDNWKQASIGRSPLYIHTAAVKTDGSLWIWGNNFSGQLGDGTTDAKSSPVQTITGGYNWKQVSCGRQFTAAVKADGTLWVWGDNSYGALGDGTGVSKSSPVQIVTGTNNWDQVSCGYYHAAAVKTDGTLWSWGDNYNGQLGDNTTASKVSPVQDITGGNNWKQVSCGDGFTAAVKTDGTLWAWGKAANGVLGDDTTVNKSSPVQLITGGNNWKQVSCGYQSTAAVKTDGTLWTWGQNSYGELGDGTMVSKSSPAQTVMGGYRWLSVSIGPHALAIAADVISGDRGGTGVANTNKTITIGGNLTTSGAFDTTLTSTANTSVTLPVTGTLATLNDIATPNDVEALNDKIELEGAAWLWGTGEYGALGDDTGTNRSSPIQTITGGSNWKQASCGFHSTAAVKTDGTLWGWGSNNDGQLGDGTRGTPRYSPVQTTIGGNNWKQVSRGKSQTSTHTAAVKIDGTLWTWGNNNAGQLGDGTTTSAFDRKTSPEQTITGGTNWKQVSCGLNYTAAIKADGTLWTWGQNSYGQLGDDSVVDRSSPVQTIAGGNIWKQVACGYRHTAAVKTDGTLWLWGRNYFGQLGDDTITDKSSPIQTVAGGTDWNLVSGGETHTAAVKANGSLWLWGFNGDGRIGNDETTNYSSPVQTITGGTNWKQVSCGYNSTAAVKTDGTLWLWGNNAYGRLGDNTTDSKSSPVQTVTGGYRWLSVSIGRHALAVAADVISGDRGGTGVANTDKTITIGGNLTTSGAFDTTLTAIANTSVTLPTTGTLATLDGSETLTNKTLSTNTTWNGDVIAGDYGGTGVANTDKTITIGGNLTTSGAFDTTLTSTANTSVTLPTTGTLATLDGSETLTNKTLSTNTTWNGNVVTGQYGGTGVANTGKTITIGGNLTTSGAFTTTITSTANTSVTLPTTGTLSTLAGVESFTNKTLSTNTTWNGNLITGQYGGTGVANTGKTITIGGNLTTSGSFDTSITITAGTSITLPTAGTLATLAGSETLTNKTLSTNTTWNGNVVTGQYGGTGIANTGKTITIGGNLTTSGAFTTTLTATANTSVTLPTTGTLSTLAGSETLTNKTLSTNVDYNGNVVLGQYGGTGIANTGKTITIGGNLTTSGAFTTTLTATANTSITLPTTGTLATLAGTESLSNKYITTGAGNTTVAGLILTSGTNTTAVANGSIEFDNTNFYFSFAGARKVNAYLDSNLTGTWSGAVVAGQYGGTGIANTGKTITIGGNLTTSGAFTTTLTATANTSVTLPTTGTLATLAGIESFTNKTMSTNTTWNGNVIPGQYGGTGIANTGFTLTMAGNITYSGAFTQSFAATANTSVTLPTTGTLSTLAGTESLSNKYITTGAGNTTVAGLKLTSGSNTTAVANGSIEFDNVNYYFSLAGARKTVAYLDSNLTGTWSGTVVAGQYGGTGIANAGKTITIGGNLTTSGAFTTTLTATANTSVTLPTAGTLATLAGIESFSNKYITTGAGNTTVAGLILTSGSNTTAVANGSIEFDNTNFYFSFAGARKVNAYLDSNLTGTWSGTAVAGQYGGTGIANTGKTITIGGNLTTSGAFTTTLTSTANTSITLPTTGTLSTLAGTESLSNKYITTGAGNTTVAGLILTSGTNTTAVANGSIEFDNVNYYFSVAGARKVNAYLDSNLTGTWSGTVVAGQYGGTGIANTGKTITIGGNLTTSGAFTTTLTATANTSVTLPTTGTLATLAGTESFSNKYITTGAGNTTVAGLVLTSGTNTTAVANGSIEFDNTNFYFSFAGARKVNAYLDSNLTGTWSGTVVAGQYGGTGIANTGKTITIGGNLTTSGAFTTTLTATANTSVTLPTAGTLATLAGSETLTNKTLSTNVDFNGNLITGQYGGTGIANTGKTITIGGNLTTSGAFTTTLTATANTSITLPTTGTLSTLAGTESLSNKYITTGAGNTSVAGLILTSGTNTTAVANGSIEFDNTNFYFSLAGARKVNAYLDSNLTGTWSGTVVAGQYGGTGIANTGKTITIGGNLTTSGAFTTTLTSTANTSITLPTTGTLSTLAGTESLSNKYITTGAGNTTVAGLILTSGTNTTAVANGSIEFDNVNYYFSVAGARKVNAYLDSNLTGTWSGTAVAGQYGGTGIANTGKTITIGGNLTTSGAFTTTLTATANTSITLPTAGTLSTLAGGETLTNKVMSTNTTWNGNVIPGQYGGTGIANTGFTLTMAGNITHSGAFTQSFAATANTSLTLPTTGTLATLAGTESFSNKYITTGAGNTTVAGLKLTSGTNTTAVANGSIEFDNTNYYFSLAGARKTVAYLDSNLTGTWSGTVVAGQYGGTGIANTGKTITIGGNLTTSGAFTTTLTATANTSVTLPTTGTLATLAGAETLSSKIVNLVAGNATTAPLKFVSGTNMTAAAAGNMEFDGTRLYFSPSTTRQTVAFLTDITGGLTVADDTSTAATRYLVFTSATSGSVSTANVSSTKLYFNPSTGDLTAGGNITALSDRTLKSNITTISDALNKVVSLRGVEFDWIESGGHGIGVIAQEVEEVIPEVVLTHMGLKSVAYGNLIAVLIEAIKDQDKRIKLLEALVERLVK
jgi:alpha-tubulin suppressor-like RCC1 family protein